MNGRASTIVFLGSARCYHTLDWFRSAQELLPENPPVMITDLIEGESFPKLINANDIVYRLVVIDRALLAKQGKIGSVWRNIVKLGVLPWQVVALRRLLRKLPSPIVHAHSMYYIALARLAGFPYVGTPQGSELLVRPYRSLAYRLFAGFAVRRARAITVDSEAMRESSRKLYGRDAYVFQNGINIHEIEKVIASDECRSKIVSVRAICENYQIEELVNAREEQVPNQPLSFCYPFVDVAYKRRVEAKYSKHDSDLGCLARLDLYRLLKSASLVLSIPVSDSSPRSVYEAIFCGCAVAVTPGGWISNLPPCMRARLFVVDIASDTWFADALDFARRTIATPYVPTEDARAMFDQRLSMRHIIQEVYPLAACSILNESI